MKKERAEQFSREVETYRRSLLYYARKRDWEEFKAKAGRLFDYVETIEYSELERRFFTVFGIVLAALVLSTITLFGVNFEISPELMRLKITIILIALAATGYELYFYLNFRMYVDIRTSHYGQRRENFIRNIEQDFRSFDLQSGRDAA
jgi:ABC-type multidrug transport system fused ATPase/permease subunit